VTVFVELLGKERQLATWGPFEEHERAERWAKEQQDKYPDAHARYVVGEQYTPDVPITSAGGPEIPR
jgi:hypothetical protein